MIPAKIQSALWSRPRSRVEWGFCLVLLAMMGAGAAWLASHSGAEDWGALRDWFATIEGDTSLKLRTADFVRGGLMLSAISWIAIGAILWLTRHWWLFSRSQDHRGKTRPDRQFLLGLALILILAAAIRLPRLNLSLYNDEVDVFRTAIAGSFDGKVLDDPTNPAPAGFREVTWMETVWGNRIGNNHVLHSILARAGYDAWRKVSGAPPGTVREWPLRFPVLLGGLLSIALIALIARQIASAGLPNHHLGSRLGLISAFLLSIHPWHVRYSTEARGYGLVFGFAALAFFFLLLAMERRRWRYWLAFGASQALCLWACLGSLHLIVGLNLVTGLTLIWPARHP
ncbi:MAG: glycosyltransferase family 39 protein, partial [Verrucomicrobiae bacterium]|nr:glycosyltransferase family 39 protein [Verrucomicrobiae bacterium]